MAWYKAGTISVTQGSAKVYGVGTAFLENIRYGDILLVNDKLFEIRSAETDLELTLTEPYAGETAVGVAFAVIRNMTNATNYDLMRQIEQLIDDRRAALVEFSAWVAGTATGGPNSDGKYPLTARDGTVFLISCPARMQMDAGTDQVTAISQLQTHVQGLSTMLAGYEALVTRVNGLRGYTLEELDGQPKNPKLTSLSALTLQPNHIPVALSDEQFAQIPISDRGKSLIAADSQQDMRMLLGIDLSSIGGGGVSSRQPGRLLAGLGTSLTQQCNYGAVGEVSHTNRSWLAWAAALTHGRVVTPVWHDMGLYPGWEQNNNVGKPRGFRGLNAGVSSDNAPNIFERAGYLVANVDCDIVVVDCGVNDLGVSAMTAEKIQEIRENLVKYLIANGKTVILMTIPSAGFSYHAQGDIRRQKMLKINQMTRDFCMNRPGCYLYDWNAGLMDFNSSTGQPKEAHTTDGLHLAPAGAYEIGKGLAKIIETIVPPAAPRVWSPEDAFNATTCPYGNLIGNPFMLGNSGTLETNASGVIAAGFRGGLNEGAGSAVYSKVAREDGRGQWQQVAVTADQTTPGTIVLRVADMAHSFPEGTWIQGSIEVEVEGWDGWYAVNLAIRDLDVNGLRANAMRPYEDHYMKNEAWKGLLVTPAIQVKAGSQLRWRVELQTRAGITGTGVVRIGAAEMRQVGNPRVLVNER